MKVPEANYRASLKYKAEKCRPIKFELNKRLYEDVLLWLDSQENKQGYIKALIRADMERNGFKMPEGSAEE